MEAVICSKGDVVRCDLPVKRASEKDSVIILVSPNSMVSKSPIGHPQERREILSAQK